MDDADVTTIERCLGWSRFAELLEDKLVTSPQNHATVAGPNAPADRTPPHRTLNNLG